MMLKKNDQIPNATMLHRMVHSTSTTTRNKRSNEKRRISESSSAGSECTFVVKIIFWNDALRIGRFNWRCIKLEFEK